MINVILSSTFPNVNKCNIIYQHHRTILKLIYVCAYKPNTTMPTLNANQKNILTLSSHTERHRFQQGKI